MTRICTDGGCAGMHGSVSTGNRLIPQPGAVMDNPREES
jgi:hypothetical protein